MTSDISDRQNGHNIYKYIYTREWQSVILKVWVLSDIGHDNHTKHTKHTTTHNNNTSAHLLCHRHNHQITDALSFLFQYLPSTIKHEISHHRQERKLLLLLMLHIESLVLVLFKLICFPKVSSSSSSSSSSSYRHVESGTISMQMTIHVTTITTTTNANTNTNNTRIHSFNFRQLCVVN